MGKRAASTPPGAAWERPAGLSRRGWTVLAAVVLLVNLPLLLRAVRSAPRAEVTLPFSDDFSSPETVAAHYHRLGGFPRVVEGQLLSPGTKNAPLWLRASLPRDVRIELTARPPTAESEVRVHVFGNGVDPVSGYELILGTWSPVLGPGRLPSSLVRLDENAPTLAKFQDRAQRAGTSDLTRVGYGPRTGVRVEGPPAAPQPGHLYRMVIERRGATLRWTVDGERWLELTDPFPLEGRGHDRLGLASMEGDVYYDDLRVTPLDGAPFPAEAPTERRADRAMVPGAFSDSFMREDLGPDWLPTDPRVVRLEQGALTLEGAHNHPVWLRRPIPTNAVVEFDAWSDSPDGDIKVEVWGDGQSSHQGPLQAAYTASGYVFVMGGWRNTQSVIARREEHAENRVARSSPRVEPGRHYHWTLRRQGGEISWSIDGAPFLQLTDPDPLVGPSHQFLGFSGWETRVHFDELSIRPL